MQLVRTAKHYFNAKWAWQEGFPQARSIEHARKAWEPYVQTWTQWIAQGRHLAPWSKWKSFYGQQPHYRLAWIMHEPFWQALAQYSSHHMFSWWPEITKEAAFQANTVALACIPTHHRQAYFRRVEDGTQSIHPRSARWAQDMGWLAPGHAHLNHWTLDSPLNTSPWRQGYACLDARQRGSFSMAQWCLGALECYGLTDDQAVDAVGHCMRLCILHRWDKYSTEWQWFENTVRPTYRSRIDWDILAALHGIALPGKHGLRRCFALPSMHPTKEGLAKKRCVFCAPIPCCNSSWIWPNPEASKTSTMPSFEATNMHAWTCSMFQAKVSFKPIEAVVSYTCIEQQIRTILLFFPV